MPYVSPTTLSDSYDVVIVGSGASGGQAAYTLTMEGVKVLMLEAGRRYDPIAETPMFQTNGQAPLRGAETPDKPLFFHDATVNGGWNIAGEPYSNAPHEGANHFLWWRSRMLGGRTNHWGREAQRHGPYDFKPYSRDGLGFDWPISYEDLAPYYDKVEMLIGVWGSNDGLENSPDSAPGVLLPPPKPRIGELLIKKKVKPLGMDVVPIHNAILSQRLDHENIPRKLHPNNPKAQRILARDMQSRAACFWATFCPRGCSIKANYQSTTVHLPPALATGNLDILTDAMARLVEVDDDGKATGVVFIDKKTGTEHRARGRAIILAAGTMETIRLLLNSKSPRFPGGLGNSSGVLGKFLLDSVSTSVAGQIPALENIPLHNEDGAGGMHHVFAPWWLYRDQKAGKLDFPRGYEVLFTSGRQMPSLGTGANMERFTQGSFGRQFKQDARRYYGSFITFKGEGQKIPNEQSFCELDPELKDQWGIPALRFHWEWTDHEYKQAAHQQRTFATMIGALGGRVLSKVDPTGRASILPGGHLKHEAGGARMGADPRTSVTNSWGRTWDVKNLMLADASVFCGNTDKGPTLTIMALAWRMADQVLERLRQHEL
jgi:choline dehydrogenase-like flavoprotein